MATNTTKRTRSSKATPPLQNAEEYILSLDLSTLQARFTRDRPDPNELNRAIVIEYKRFLILKLVHHDINARILSPSPLVDAIWHLHILDTAAYAEMCAQLPFFIHHNPDGGLDLALRQYRYTTTLDSYKEKWGEPASIIWPKELEIPPSPANSDNVKTQTTVENGQYISVAKQSTGELVYFQVNLESPRTLVAHVMKAFSKKIGMEYDVNKLGFLYEGERMQPGRSLKSYGVENGDTLDAYRPLVGC